MWRGEDGNREVRWDGEEVRMGQEGGGGKGDEEGGGEEGGRREEGKGVMGWGGGRVRDGMRWDFRNQRTSAPELSS